MPRRPPSKKRSSRKRASRKGRSAAKRYRGEKTVDRWAQNVMNQLAEDMRKTTETLPQNFRTNTVIKIVGKNNYENTVTKEEKQTPAEDPTWTERIQLLKTQAETVAAQLMARFPDAIFFNDGDSRRMGHNGREWVVHPWQFVVQALMQRGATMYALKDVNGGRAPSDALGILLTGNREFHTRYTYWLADYVVDCHLGLIDQHERKWQAKEVLGYGEGVPGTLFDAYDTGPGEQL